MRAFPSKEQCDNIDKAYNKLLNDRNFQKESARMRLDKLDDEEILDLYYSKFDNLK